uniref:BURP domain-containing protein 17-like n=1 Tax=Solanum melongena TaxID=223891 RepID=A0A060PXZ6_SOLME|nr:BURP domain-containing protein 17-like [Solanum melongena]
MPKPIKDALHISEEKLKPEDELDKLRQWGVYARYDGVPKSELRKLHQPYGVYTWYRGAAEDPVYARYHDASENELHKVHQPSLKDHKENHLVMPYFFETHLHQGKQLNLLSLKNNNPAPFLPRKIVDSIPFSSDKIEEIFSYFSVDKDSKPAEMIGKTIKLCEGPAGNGEVKYCATSLESMIEFTLSHVGTNNIIAISTEVEKETPEVQTYTIEKVEEKANGKGVICHKVAYPYAVHYCHDVGSTRVFMVSMVGADGTKVNGVSVCHEDTTPMNPEALPFQLLNVKPGEKPICHFTLDDQIVLFPSPNVLLQVTDN